MISIQKSALVFIALALLVGSGNSAQGQSGPPVLPALEREDLAEWSGPSYTVQRAQDGDHWETAGFWPSLHWFGSLNAEGLKTITGGLQRGTAFGDKLLVGFSARTADLGLWKGGEFSICGQQITGHDPSGRLIGDAQAASNIAAPTSITLSECWLAQKFHGSKAQIKGGLLDLNAAFMVVDSAALLINSSFGVMPTLSGNTVASIFPKPGYGLILESDGPVLGGRIGFFQGDPMRRSSLFHGGYMLISEGSRLWGGAGGLYGVAKAGAWKYGGAANGSSPCGWGAYIAVEQRIWYLGSGGLTLFAQASLDPPRIHPVEDYIGCGIDWTAPFPTREKDHLIGGIARAKLKDAPYKTETAYELTYVAALGKRLSFQPDLQVIVHPGGANPTAWVVTFRIALKLF